MKKKKKRETKRMNETSQQRKRRNGTNCLNGKWRNGKRKTSTEMDHGKENNCAGIEWNGMEWCLVIKPIEGDDKPVKIENWPGLLRLELQSG